MKQYMGVLDGGECLKKQLKVEGEHKIGCCSKAIRTIIQCEHLMIDCAHLKIIDI